MSCFVLVPGLASGTELVSIKSYLENSCKKFNLFSLGNYFCRLVSN